MKHKCYLYRPGEEEDEEEEDEDDDEDDDDDEEDDDPLENSELSGCIHLQLRLRHCPGDGFLHLGLERARHLTPVANGSSV